MFQKHSYVLFALLAVSLFLYAGCSDDSDDVAGPSSPTTGTIVVNPEPNSIAAPWTLSGPENTIIEGSGDQTLADSDPGEYTLTWGEVADYITPASDTQTLDADAIMTFNGTYEETAELPDGFVLIPTGTFTMGSPTTELAHGVDEVQHEVVLTTPFYMSITEVTNAQYAALAQWALDHDPPLVTATSSSLQDALDGSTQELMDLFYENCDISFSGGVFTVDTGKEDHPAIGVSWYGSAAYCDWLSLQAGLARAYDHSTWECNDHDPYAALGYRLPTEAEWEYACRAGSETAFTNGDITNIECGDPVLDQIGWYCQMDWTHPVGLLLVNDFGLYDIHGNVVEWCNDWYESYGGDVTDPVGPASGTQRVMRGGSWSYDAENCRSAVRYNGLPHNSGVSYGFRPVMSAN